MFSDFGHKKCNFRQKLRFSKLISACPEKCFQQFSVKHLNFKNFIRAWSEKEIEFSWSPEKSFLRVQRSIFSDF